MIQSILLKQLRNRIDQEIGLYYSDDRLETLQRRLQKAATDLKMDDCTFTSHLLQKVWDRETISLLAKYLTIPETYFFRDRSMFDLLEDIIVPQILQRCAKQNDPVIIWSSSCATGEEPYSLAILLHKLLPINLLSMVQIIATDINEEYLFRAKAGIYSSWSLRTTPLPIRTAYFSEVQPGKFKIAEHIRSMVTFDYANLVALEPRFQNQSVDLLLCRNTLIYFSVAQTQSVLNELSKALRPNGWCLLAPAEIPLAPPENFFAEKYPGAVLFKKREVNASESKYSTNTSPAASYPKPSSPEHLASSTRKFSTHRSIDSSCPQESAISPQSATELSLLATRKLFAEERYENAFTLAVASLDHLQNKDVVSFRLLSEYHSSNGDIPQALVAIDKAISLEQLDASLYYLKAMLLHERDDFEGAIATLKQALFIDPNFLLAEFMLSSFLGKIGNERESAIHMRNTETLLSTLPSDAILPESDGMSVGQLQELVNTLRTKQNRLKQK